MLRDPHQYVLEMFKQDGTVLGRATVSPDFECAREWTRFSAIRRGELPLDDEGSAASIQQIWNAKVGEPYLGGFRVAIARNGASAVSADFSTTYFATLARQASSHFVERGRLHEGEHFTYLVTAYPGREPPAGELQPEAEEVPPALPLHESALAEFLRRGVPAGTVDAEDMPVFFLNEVLEEAAALTRAAEGRETGGFLIAKIHRDATLPEVFVQITAQIPAQAEGNAVKLCFTPATWTAGRAALALRNRNEVFAGYWHSHPVREWCKAKKCSLEELRTCSLAKDYFSEDDQAVLRVAFARAYSLGLVVNDPPLGALNFSLFGWRQGLIQPRGYYILRG